MPSGLLVFEQAVDLGDRAFDLAPQGRVRLP
jgi:hypothetical protein